MADENVEDNFWNFLGEEDPFAYVPPLTSETQAYLDWESTASRDRFSDEYSLQRFPGQGPYGLGNLTLPEWFPPEYATYANSLAPYYNRQQINRASTTSNEIVYEGEDLLAQIMTDLQDPAPIIGITPDDILTSNTTSKDFWNPDSQSFVPNPNFNASTVPDQFDQVINDTTFLYDPTKVRTLSGESIVDQEWFTPEKEEVLRAYFTDVLPASDPAFLQDRGSIAKSLVWGEVRQALAAGVDPDAIWAELKPMSEKPHDSWANSQPLTEGGEAVEFQVMTAEHSLAKFDEFTYKLGELRATDPDIYQETYGYLPLQDKLRYLNDLQSKGSLTKEEYEGLYIQEVNSLYDPEKTPNNYRFVELEGKTYLDTSGSRELNVQRDLFDHDFYPDTSDPLTRYNSYTSIGPSTQGTRTNDFDSNAFDFFDPIMNIVTMFAPVVGLAYTAVKGLSGETLHTSDWLRAAPGVIEGINYSFEKLKLDLAIPTTLQEVFPNIDLAEFGGINISAVGGGTAAEMTRKDGGPLGIPDLIEIGTVLSAPNPSTIYNPDGTERTGAYGQKLSRRDKELLEQGVILNMTQQMTEAGVPIPEGAFDVDPSTGMFININGEPVGFQEVYKGVLDYYRQQKPKEFAVSIVEASENENTAQSLSQILGATTYNLAKTLVDDSKLEKMFGGEDSNAQQIIATVLAGGGAVAYNLNGAIMYADEYPDNTEISKFARNVLALSDANNVTSVKDQLDDLEKLNKDFKSEVYMEVPTKAQLRDSAKYRVELETNGLEAAEKYVLDRINNVEGLNGAINGTRKFFKGFATAPYAVTAEIGSELVEEIPSIVASLLGKTVIGASLKRGAAFTKNVDVKDLKNDVLEAINKSENFSALTINFVNDIVEAVGGSSAEGFDSAMATLRRVQTDEIIESDEFKNHTEDLKGKVKAGVLTEAQYSTGVQDYIKGVLLENDPVNREIAAKIGADTGMAGGALMLIGQAVFGNAVDVKILTKAFGKNADVVKDMGQNFVDQAKKWAKELGKDISGGANALYKDWLSEFGEEGGTSAIKNSRLQQIDPTINVTEESVGDGWFGSVTGLGVSTTLLTQNYILDTLKNAGLSTTGSVRNGTSSLLGAGVTGATNLAAGVKNYVPVVGDFAARVLVNSNSQLNDALALNPDGTPKLTEQGIKDVFDSAGLTPENFPSSYATLMNHAYDENYVSPQEASQAFYEFGYVPSQEEIDTYIGSTEGRDFTDDTLESVIDTYVDPRQLTPDEVNAWAASSGITLTDDQVAELAVQYSDPSDTSQRLLDLLGDGTKVTDLNGNNIPDGFETGVINSTNGTNNQLPAGTHPESLMEGFLKPGSLIRLKDGTDVPSDDPRFGGMYTDSNGNGNVDSVDIRNGNARLNSDTGVVEFPDSDGNYDSDLDTSGVDTDGDGILDEDDAFPNDPSEDGLTSIPNEDTGGIDVFDNNGNRVSSIDGQGNTTTYNDDGSSETKNSDNQVTSTTDSGGDITTYQYNGDGSYSTTNSTSGVQTNYDPDGKVIVPTGTNNQLPAGTYPESLMETILPEGSLIRLENGDDVRSDDPRFGGMYTDSNDNDNVDSVDIKNGNARLNSDTGVVEFLDPTTGLYSDVDPDPDPDADPNSITQTGLTQDQLTTALQGVLDAAGLSTLTKDQVQAIANDLLSKIPAGITAEEVTAAVTEALSQYDVSTLTQDQVNDLLTTQLGTQTTDILAGTGQQVGASTDAILERSNEIESAGIARDQALSTAINEVSTQLGTTKTELLNRIGETEQTLLTRLGEVESNVIQGQQELGEDIQLVADYVGKDVGQVTDADIDFVADIIAQQEANTELAVLTQQQLQYDVNNDGVIDINDQTMLEQAQAGQDVDFARMFNPTGLYEVNQQTQQDIQTAQDLNTQQNLNMQQQIESTRQRGNEEELLRDILGSSDLTGNKASTQQMGTANINYLYDIGGDSVFAPNARTNLFSPYGASNVVPAIQPQARQIRQQPRAAAQGGLLSRNNELLRLLGED